MLLKQMRRSKRSTLRWLVYQTLLNEDNIIKWAIAICLSEENQQEGLEIITDRTTDIISIEVISEATTMMILTPPRTSSNSCFSVNGHGLVREEINNNSSNVVTLIKEMTRTFN